MMNSFWNFPPRETRTYFTIGEIMDIVKGNNQEWDRMVPYDQNIGVYGIIDDDYIEVAERDTEYTIKLLQDYIWPQFWDKAVMYVDGEYDNQDILDAWEHKKSKIYRWINESKEVYEITIAQLEANKDKLLNQIKSTSSTKFNDTPQEPGIFTEDQYTSNITNTETTTEANTMMARLKEIQDDLKSLYGKWANEFSRFIIFSAN